MPAPTTHMTKDALIKSGMFPPFLVDNPSMRYFCFSVPEATRAEAPNAHITHASRFATADVWVGQAADGVVYAATLGVVHGGYVELT